jgi:glycosyltransferase involved in cell wall biosynthesis
VDSSLLDGLPLSVNVHAQTAGLAGPAIRRSLRRTAAGGGALARLTSGLAWRFESWIGGEPCPDEYVAWARRSIDPLIRMIRRHRVDVLYSTFSPASNHWLGLMLKRQTGLPWVADFRDLWTDDYRYVEPSEQRREAHRRLEQTVLDTADAVVGVTPRQTEILRGRVTNAADRFTTITNGFDPDDFADAASPCHSPTNEFVLAHVGRFDRWRVDDAWFAGLARFASDLGAHRDRFVFRLVGHAGEQVRRRVLAAGVRFECVGYVSHGQAIRAMHDASALLLAVPSGPNADSVIPAKLFEYLASKRPILVVGPEDGCAERIVRSTHSGMAVGFDEAAIAESLRRLHDAHRSGRPMAGCSTDRLTPYRRDVLTKSLAGVLARVSGTNRAVRPKAREPQTVGV